MESISRFSLFISQLNMVGEKSPTLPQRQLTYNIIVLIAQNTATSHVHDMRSRDTDEKIRNKYTQ